MRKIFLFLGRDLFLLLWGRIGFFENKNTFVTIIWLGVVSNFFDLGYPLIRYKHQYRTQLLLFSFL